MATVSWRPDYARFLIECEPEVWHQYYAELGRESHECKFAGEWLKSHKVNRLWFNNQSGRETWSIDIWGEWAGIVTRLPSAWIEFLRRFDVRSIVWDANKDTVLDIGQHLQRHITRYNINVYSTKPASKRLGRDRGGVGFAIGSHKSDLRITTYKRTGEPVGQEFQCSGAMLEHIVERLHDDFNFSNPTVDYYNLLLKEIVKQGTRRLGEVLKLAGITTYWPVVGAADLPVLPDKQGAFIAQLVDFPDGEDRALLSRDDGID